MSSNTDDTVWAVREAYLNLLELVDTASQDSEAESRKSLREEAEQTVLMFAAAVILADGKYDPREQEFVRLFTNISGGTGKELTHLNEFARKWVEAATRIPAFFHAALKHDMKYGTSLAQMMMGELQFIGNNVSISDKRFRAAEVKIVNSYLNLLETFVANYMKEQGD
jgi:hypothetical protein